MESARFAYCMRLHEAMRQTCKETRVLSTSAPIDDEEGVEGSPVADTRGGTNVDAIARDVQREKSHHPK
jgi:hypothetical protein